MNAERRAIAAEILEVSRTHDAAQKDRLARLRNVEPETAELLGILIRATRAERILELGTSNGYSTLWLADGAEATGGAVLSVDLDGDRTNMAAENLDRAGLLAVLRTADAADVLATAKDESWDLIFLDSERPAYVSYWPDLLRTMRSTGWRARDRQRHLARRRGRRGHGTNRTRALRSQLRGFDRSRRAAGRTRQRLTRAENNRRRRRRARPAGPPPRCRQ